MSTPPILPTEGVDHWPWRMFLPTELSSHASSPVTLLTAMIAGAFGDGTFTWLSSWPFDVLTRMRSPNETGDEFERLCGYEPTCSIMSKNHSASASCGPVSFSLVIGPWLPSLKPFRSTHHRTPRLLT